MMKKYLFVIIVLTVWILAGSTMYAQDQQGEERLIRIETSLGNMTLKLYNETPQHRDNMIKLIEEGFFDKQLFHRVIKDFMIQGGDPHSVEAQRGQRLGSGGPGYTVPAEFIEGLIHKKGALAAARKGDQVNPEKVSSGSQFYIIQGRVLTPEELDLMVQRGMITLDKMKTEIYTTIGGTPHLDGSYTVFGEVVEGLDVLDRIAATETDTYNRPLEDVIYTISVIR